MHVSRFLKGGLFVLIKLRSAQSRTEGTTYVGYGIVQFRESIEQPDGATRW